MSESKFWLCFWAVVFGNITACSVLSPRPSSPSVECAEVGGQWTGIFGYCAAKPTPTNPNRSEER